jgi:hypothetical protein
MPTGSETPRASASGGVWEWPSASNDPARQAEKSLVGGLPMGALIGIAGAVTSFLLVRRCRTKVPGDTRSSASRENRGESDSGDAPTATTIAPVTIECTRDMLAPQWMSNVASAPEGVWDELSDEID